MKTALLCVALALLSGCAMNYKGPTILVRQHSTSVHATQAQVFTAAQRVLVADGYQITAANASAGVISTAPRDMRLTPAQADCGTTMGLDYLKDKRTDTRVAFGVVTGNNTFTVRANIQGQYKPGGVDGPTENITLTCVSRGSLEQAMQSQILDAIQSEAASQ